MKGKNLIQFLEDAENEISTLTWKTQKGKIVPVWEMDTDHVYNSLKMLYNHLATGCGMATVKPFQNMYFEANSLKPTNRKDMVKRAMAFLLVIDKRGDLPYENDEGYDIIKTNLNNPFVIMKLLKGRKK